jgi:hypothetical protein
MAHGPHPAPALNPRGTFVVDAAEEKTMTDPDTSTPDRNISTEHQEPGDARRPADTLDREQADPDPEQKIGRG